MKRCPECFGQGQPIGNQDFFCLNCDFDTLKSSTFQGVVETRKLSTPRRPRRNTTVAAYHHEKARILGEAG